MFKLIDWMIQNRVAVGVFLGVASILAFLKPVVNLLRGVKDGLKELLTPAGVLALILLLGLGIFLYVFFKGLF